MWAISSSAKNKDISKHVKEVTTAENNNTK
jgi:hypothetical protein